MSHGPRAAKHAQTPKRCIVLQHPLVIEIAVHAMIYMIIAIPYCCESWDDGSTVHVCGKLVTNDARNAVLTAFLVHCITQPPTLAHTHGGAGPGGYAPGLQTRHLALARAAGTAPRAC